MKNKLLGKKIAILVAHGFEETEFTRPVKALEQASANYDVVSLTSGKVKAWAKDDWGDEFDVDKTVKKAKPQDYDALVLPGGVMNPDSLRNDEDAVAFVRHFVQTNKPIAAICHGPWPLINAGGVSGKRMTSYPSIKMDLINAGADWVDEEVVVDNGLVTSRRPLDLKAFCEKMVEEFSEGMHHDQTDAYGSALASR